MVLHGEMARMIYRVRKGVTNKVPNSIAGVEKGEVIEASADEQTEEVKEEPEASEETAEGTAEESTSVASDVIDLSTREELCQEENDSEMVSIEGYLPSTIRRITWLPCPLVLVRMTLSCTEIMES